MTKVSQWYVPGSLKNLPRKGKTIPGFRFTFKVCYIRVEFYAAHRVILTIDGTEVPSDSLFLVRDGKRIMSEEMASTDWMPHQGDAIDVIVEQPGGLGPGRHEINLDVLLGGRFGGRPKLRGREKAAERTLSVLLSGQVDGVLGSVKPLCAFSDSVNGREKS
jgi:hypothetical protein